MDTYVFIIVMCFIVIVIPTWMKMHYANSTKPTSKLTEDEKGKLQELNTLAVDLNDRMQTLEAILDAESPEWRNKYDH